MAYSKKEAVKTSGVNAVQGTVSASIAVLVTYVMKRIDPGASGEVVVAVAVLSTAVIMAVVGFVQHIAGHYLQIGGEK